MDASPSSLSSSSSSSLAPLLEQQRHEDHHRQEQTASKKIRLTTVSSDNKKNQNTVTPATALPTKSDHIVTAPSSLDALPLGMLSEVGTFAAGGRSSLSGASRTTLKAIREVHLKIDTLRKYRSFHTEEAQSLLIDPTGALRSGRVVAHITIITAMTSWHSKEANDAFEKFMRHTIPTLRSIRLTGIGGKCSVLDALIPRSSKRFVVAPNLTRVVLRGRATLVHKAGKVIAAGLWPALEELTLRGCGANAGHFENLAGAMRSGRAPNLRLLNWNTQSSIRENRLDDVVLSALASGQCPLIESLSFTENQFCPEHTISWLGVALRACSNLRVLEMDCSRRPGRELRTLTNALEAGNVPLLTRIFVRATKAYDSKDGTREGVKALRRAAEQRVTPVEVGTEIKTCHPKNRGLRRLGGGGHYTARLLTMSG